MTTNIRFAAVSLDCSDPRDLATFYSRLAGLPVAMETDTFVALQGSVWITTQRVADYSPPTWPDPDVPQQVHLDFATDDLDGAVEVATRLGARLAAVQPRPDVWRVMLDPAGHPFCFSTLVPEGA